MLPFELYYKANGNDEMASSGITTQRYQDAQVDHTRLQRDHREAFEGRTGVGGAGCKGQAVLILKVAFNGGVFYGGYWQVLGPTTRGEKVIGADRFALSRASLGEESLTSYCGS